MVFLQAAANVPAGSPVGFAPDPTPRLGGTPPAQGCGQGAATPNPPIKLGDLGGNLLSLKALQNKEPSPSDHAGAGDPASPTKGRIESPREGPCLCSRWLEAVGQGRRLQAAFLGQWLRLPTDAVQQRRCHQEQGRRCQPWDGTRSWTFPLLDLQKRLVK